MTHTEAQRHKSVSDLCKESKAFKKQITNLVLDGPMGAYDRNTGKPVFQGQQSAHAHCKDEYLTVDELVARMGFGDSRDLVSDTLRKDVYSLLRREYDRGRMKREKVVCSITDRDCWGYKSII